MEIYNASPNKVADEVASSAVGRRQSTRKSFGSDYVENIDAVLRGQQDMNDDEGNTHSLSVFITHDVPAVCEFFRAQLESFIVECGGSSLHLNGWKIDIQKRCGGLSAFTTDVFYVNTNSSVRTSSANATHTGKAYRTRVEVAIAVGLMPNFKLLSQLTKQQMHENSKENRERLLVSQKLQRLNFVCSNDAMVVDGSEISVPSKDESGAEDPEDLFFGFGNTTVLSWGDIVPDNTLFHTKTQLYPLGFKCLRQEHDLLSNVIVDCLCEILGTDGKSTFDSVDGVNTADENFSPLFRITVAWIVNKMERVTGGEACSSSSVPSDQAAADGVLVTGNRRMVRVYEGKTPQQAWQGVLLESIGCGEDDDACEGGASPTPATNAASPTLLAAGEPVGDQLVSEAPTVDGGSDLSSSSAVAENAPAAADEVSVPDAAAAVIPNHIAVVAVEGPQSPDTVIVDPTMDEEEVSLREAVRAARKEYFRTLKQAQSQGKCGSVVPRLILDYVDSFVDEGLMRLLEGMNNVHLCGNYQFMDTRFKDGGKKHLARAFSKMSSLNKSIERVEKRRISELLSEERTLNKKLKSYEMQQRVGVADMGLGEEFESFIRMGVTVIRRRKKFPKKHRVKEAHGGESGILGMIRRRRRRRDADGKLIDVGDMGSEEFRSKTHAKKPTGARQRISLVAQQKEKLRELDKSVNRLKTANMREMRKLRDEVRARVEAAADDEVRRMAHTASTKAISSYESAVVGEREALPLPREGPIRVSGDVYGQLLELWSFCSAYSKQLHIASLPHLDYLTAALHTCEPTVKRLSREGGELSSSASLEHMQFLATNNPMADSTQAYHLWYNAMTAEEADSILNKFGMILCEHLISEYSSIITHSAAPGESAAPAHVGRGGDHEAAALTALAGCRHKLNPLTWKEIARTVLLATAYQEIGASEAEAVMAVRGSGHLVTADAADATMLGLIKERLVSNYNERGPNREALVGFTAGICATIPRPSPCVTANAQLSICGSTWQQCIDVLFNETDGSCNWKIYEVVQLMIRVCGQFEDYWHSNSAAQSGHAASTFSPTAGGGSVKQGSVRKYKLSAFYSGMLVQIQRVRKLLTDSLTSYMIRSPSHSAELKTSLEQLCEQFHNSFVVNVSVDGPQIPESEMTELREIKEFEMCKHNLLQLYYTELSVLCHEQDEAKATATAVSHGVIDFWKSNQKEIDSILAGYPSADLDQLRALGFELISDISSPSSNAGTADLPGQVANGMAVDSEAVDGGEMEAEGAELVGEERYVLDISEEEVRLPSLSVAMQRCYIVVRDIMAHEHATILNYPVDHEELPGYYDLIKQPLSFYDIRVYLMAGKYKDRISAFYTDMNLVIDNALTFNSDGYAVAQSAHKLRVLFERYFYESVLSWDCALGFHDNCPICRSADHVCAEPVVEEKIAPIRVVTVWTKTAKPKTSSEKLHSEASQGSLSGRSRSSKSMVDVGSEEEFDEELLADDTVVEDEESAVSEDPYESNDTKAFVPGCVVCAKCEGSYHANCVINVCDSEAETASVLAQLAWAKKHKSKSESSSSKNGAKNSAPKEWFCQSCIEAKSIAQVHPCKLSKVRHPFAKTKEGGDKLGEVVGIVQSKERIQFIIGFDGYSVREMWTPEQVRKYCVSWQGSGAAESSAGIPELPSGYDWNDYERVCGMARCYNGWGGTSSSCATFINDNYNLAASRRALQDGTFRSYLDAISLLSTSHAVSCNTVSATQTYSAQEWMTVLVALKNKILTVPHLTDALFENEVQNDMAAHKVRDVVNRIIASREDGSIEDTEVSMLSIVKELQNERIERDENEVNMEVGYGIESTTLSREFGGASPGSRSAPSVADADGDEEWMEDHLGADGDYSGETGGKQASSSSSKKAVSKSSSSPATAVVIPSNGNTSKSGKKAKIIRESESEEEEWSEWADDVDAFQEDFDDAMAESTDDEVGGDMSVDEGESAAEEEEEDKPETAEGWELRRMSRFRARDDVLSTLGVLMDMFPLIKAQNLDDLEKYETYRQIVSTFQDRNAAGADADEDATGASTMGGTMFDTVPAGINTVSCATPGLLAVAKSIIPKIPSHPIDVAEWENTFCAKFMDSADLDCVKFPEHVSETNLDASAVADSAVAASAEGGEGGEAEDKEEAEVVVSPTPSSNITVDVVVDPSSSTSVASMMSMQPTTTCSYCHCSDSAICSTMVQGCTWDEWYEQVVEVTLKFNGKSSSLYNYCCGRDHSHCNSIGNCASQEDSKAGPRRFGKSQFIRAMWVPENGNAVYSEAGSCGHGSAGQQQRAVYWLPVDPKDAAQELEEISSKHPCIISADSDSSSCTFNGSEGGFVLKGSLPMHEHCATVLHSKRLDSVVQLMKDENEGLVEVLEGLHRGKISPLGSDGRCNSYFVFPSVPYLFVLHPPVNEKKPLEVGVGLDMANLRHTAGVPVSFQSLGLSSLAVDLSTTSDSLLSRYAVHKQNMRCNETSTGPKPASMDIDAFTIGRSAMNLSARGSSSSGDPAEVCRWSVYADLADVDRLIHSLDCCVKSEQKLSRVLSLLFPSSRTCSKDQTASEQSLDTDSHLISSMQKLSADLKKACTVEPTVRSSAWINNEVDERFELNIWGNSESEAEGEEGDVAASDDKIGDAASKPKSPVDSDFNVGDVVLVEAGSFDLKWDAVVIDVSRNRTAPGTSTNTSKASSGKSKSCFYKVRFDYWKCFNSATRRWYISDERSLSSEQWKYQYIGWFPTSSLSLKSPNQLSIQGSLMRKTVRDSVDEVPPALKAMKAFQYLNSPDRVRSGQQQLSAMSAAIIGLGGGYFPGYINGGGVTTAELVRKQQYSMCLHGDAGTFHTLKQGLLMIESALPRGCLDEQGGDKWQLGASTAAGLRSAEAQLFHEVWREGVVSSNDASSLMQCVLFLEHCIKIAWFTQNGVKNILPSLPSRQYSLRHASLPMIAVRIYALDQCIRYDKYSFGNSSTPAASSAALKKSSIPKKSNGNGNGNSKSRKR